jgi:lipopolysaccharide biosynthesis glycosyltransferase
MSKRNAVITIDIGNAYERVARVTKPKMKRYAEKIGADFISINNFTLSDHFDEYSAYWAKLQLFEYLNHYDRIVYFDLDALVLSHCPNIFEIVPEDEFGALFETDFLFENGNVGLEEYKRITGEVNWKGTYFNVGVMVLSKCHQEIFRLRKEMIFDCRFPEQLYLNYHAHENDVKFFHLDYKFNHMALFIAPEKKSLRHESYVIHYAAMDQKFREIIIELDVERFDNNLPALTDDEVFMRMEKIMGVGFMNTWIPPVLKTNEEIGLISSLV